MGELSETPRVPLRSPGAPSGGMDPLITIVDDKLDGGSIGT